MNVTALNIGSKPSSSTSIDQNSYYKRVLDDFNFDDPDIVLDEQTLDELEKIIYNNTKSFATNENNASTTKKTRNKMLPPQQHTTKLAQLPVYSYKRSFRDGEEGVGLDIQDCLTHPRQIIDLFTDFKLSPYHSLDTFGRFFQYSLNLKTDLVEEIISNPRIQLWIEKIQCYGFVTRSIIKSGEAKKIIKVPSVRCELCKFYGHLSHTCSIKDLAFKLNSVLKNGACRCHICGQLGHPAEAGLCPFIACSFCCQNGHWNYMCPNKDKISRTLCFKCQRYGHSTEVGSIKFFSNSLKILNDNQNVQ